MKELYYTPNLSEFYVGFEYEEKERFGDGTVKTIEEYDNAKWVKQIYDEYTFPYVQRTLTGKNSQTLPPAIRVKYPDKEDIESLGFRHIGTSIDMWFEKDGNFDMGSWTSYKCRIHYGFYDKRLFVEVYDCPDWTLIFQGIINNKSEFKIILKQLGIL